MTSSSIDKVTLIKTGQTFDELRAHKGCFEQWFASVFGETVPTWEVIHAHQGQALPPLNTPQAVVVTGSPVSVYERLPWSEATAAWLAELITRNIPVLGVCYGHQLIAHALGGEVRPSPHGREVGAVEIEHNGDLLFEGLPQRFSVWQSHIDEVVNPPAHARVIASNQHSSVQAMAIGEHCRTVQWHPEFDGEIGRHYIKARAHLIDQERGDGAARALEQAQPLELSSGAQLIRNFARHWLHSIH